MVETIEKKRQPFPNLEAIYLLTPDADSVAMMIEDFTVKGNMYAAAHLFFTNSILFSKFGLLTFWFSIT